MANSSNPDPQTALHIPSDPAVPMSARPVGFSSTQASVLLDMVRGLAAVAVLVGHWRNLFFVDYPAIPAHRLFFALPYLLTSSGHQAVIIFFVLSGYLVSGSVFRMFERGQWSWRSYLLQRGVRLWIVLLPGLLLAALFDFIGLHLHGATAMALYHGASGNAETGNIAASFHLSAWLGNLVFLQGIYVPVFGSDTPLWSLANEFWYYLLFPLGLLALHKGSSTRSRILCVLGFAAIAWCLPLTILFLFPAWLMGALLARLRPPTLSATWRIAAAVVYVPIAFILSKLHPALASIFTVLEDLGFGLLTFGFLYVLLSAQQRSRENSRQTHMWRTLARFSYTLYVVHVPLLVLIAAFALNVTRWNPTPSHVAVAFVFMAISVVYAYGVAALTEFRTDRLRKAIERRLPG